MTRARRPARRRRPRGRARADKATVHHGDDAPAPGLLGLPLRPRKGALLLTRRAHDKATFPGRVDQLGLRPPGARARRSPTRWRAGPLERAGGRRGRAAAGAARVRATAPRWTACVENELCPVFAAVLPGRELGLDPAEVGGAEWVPWSDLLARGAGRAARRLVVVPRAGRAALCSSARDPRDWPAADPRCSPRPPASTADVRSRSGVLDGVLLDGVLLDRVGVRQGQRASCGDHPDDHREQAVGDPLAVEERRDQAAAPRARGQLGGGQRGDHRADDGRAEARADLLGGVVERGADEVRLARHRVDRATAQIVMTVRRPIVRGTRQTAMAR